MTLQEELAKVQGAASARSILDAVSDDVGAALQVLRAIDSPYNRRALIRSCITGVEAVLWDTKKRLAKFSGITSLESMFLADETYVVSRGHLKTRAQFTPLVENIKGTYRIAARLKQDLAIDFNDLGWQSLVRSSAPLGPRNRIVHPKDVESFVVTELEVVDSLRAFYWTMTFCFRIAVKFSTASQERMALGGELDKRIYAMATAAGEDLQSYTRNIAAAILEAESRVPLLKSFGVESTAAPEPNA